MLYLFKPLDSNKIKYYLTGLTDFYDFLWIISVLEFINYKSSKELLIFLIDGFVIFV